MSPSKSDEIKRLEEAVRLVEKSGQADTVFHQQLAELTKRVPKPVKVDGEEK